MTPRRFQARRALRLVCAVCLLLAAGAWGVGESRAQTQQEWQIMQQRLQNLESDFAALRATIDIQAAEQAETDGTEAILRLARVEELLRENAGAMETLSFQIQQLQESAEAYRKDAELRFQQMEERLAAMEASVAAAVAAQEEAALSSAVTELAPEAAEVPESPVAPATAEVATDAAAGEEDIAVLQPVDAPDTLAEEAADEESTSFLENPFPDFTLASGPDTSSDSSVEQEVSGLVTDVNPELLPKPLGVVPVDEQGAVTLENPGSSEASPDSGIDPRRLYQSVYALLEQREFQENADMQTAAINGFQDFVAAWPQHELAPDAQYWVGEIFYIQEDYVAAAEAFLEGMKTYGSSPRAGDTMLKLGITLRLLEQPEKACAAFDELLFTDRFGRLSESARRRIDLERRLANC